MRRHLERERFRGITFESPRSRKHHAVAILIGNEPIVISDLYGDDRLGYAKAESVRKGLERREPDAIVIGVVNKSQYLRRITSGIFGEIEHGDGDGTHQALRGDRITLNNGNWID